MTFHAEHQTQLTSLYCYFPSFNEQYLYNEKFRMRVHRDIIDLLKIHDNLTDREMQSLLCLGERNNVSPRRFELSNPEKTKYKNGEYKFGWSVPLVVEDEHRICKVSGKVCIAWKLSNQTLNAYMGLQ